VNDAGFATAVDAISEGVTEEDVKIAMAGEMVRRGAIPKFTTVAAGPNRYDMMNPDASSKVVLEKGTMVVMDFGCTYQRYYTDVTRGVFVGEPHPRARALYGAVRDISTHALEAAKPGNPIKAIDAASEKRIRELGYLDLMMHRTGHSLGLEVHETPSIGPADETILEPGMVFAIEPGLYDFSVGAFRIEDVVLITKTGWEFLTEGSREVIVK
jgi:Xaa-Pro aminopeptidase